ncbi:MAG TPA: hypothetical protein VFZ42_01100 [Chitinophagaceae bacterium]
MRRKFKTGTHNRSILRLPGCRLLLFVAIFAATTSLHAQETIDSSVFLTDSSYSDDQDEEVEAIETDNYFTPKYLQFPPVDSVAARNIPDTSIKAYQQMDEFWYANANIKKQEDKIKKEKSKTSIFDQPWFDTLMLLVIICGFALVLIMYLSGSNVGLFRRRNKSIAEEEGTVDTDDIFQINYTREIDRAAGAGNYRLAIRLMFLRLLKNLSQKNIIQYGHDRTNFDYLLQLSSTRYYPEFFKITRHYEYSWYGKFEISKETYAFIKNEFDNFDPSIK